MIALIKREFNRNRTSFIAYCIIAIAFAWLYVALFPSIQKQSEQLDKVLKSFPTGIMKAFGVDKTGFTSIEKFLATELMSILWPILAILFTVSRSGASIAGGIENRTLGFELSLPVTRVHLYISKLVGGLIAAGVFCIVSILIIIPLCKIQSIDVGSSHIAALAVLCLLFAMTVFSLSLFVSSATSEKGHVYFTVGAILMVSYVLNIVANISSSFSWMKYLSIFYYFDTFNALTKGSISFGSIVFFVCITCITIALGLWKFRSRDIAI